MRCVYFFIIFFLFSCKALSSENEKIEILNYLNELKYFSASFIQNDGENLSEGKVYIGKKRVRAEYFTPTRILIILDENKAMYYNYELEEDQFFNPKDTNAWFLYDIFRNPLFFQDSLIKIKNKELIIEKKGFDKEDRLYSIKVYFENSPLVLRQVEIIIDDNYLKLSIYDHSYDEEFDRKFFKLIRPGLLN